MMKHIIILGDGMGGLARKVFGRKDLVAGGKTPYMDKLARMGRVGRLKTVADGFHHGQRGSVRTGLQPAESVRGTRPAEAASIGVDLKPGEMAMRCNIICIEGDDIKNHSAGHITTEEADVLVKYLQEHLGDERVRFHTGVQYRHLLVIKAETNALTARPRTMFL